jgi:predicted outer membrane protein
MRVSALALALALPGERHFEVAASGRAKDAREASKPSGAAFDRQYIDAEVKYHEAVIDGLEITLIPSAQNADLKQLLTDAVPTLEGPRRTCRAQLGGAAYAAK